MSEDNGRETTRKGVRGSAPPLENGKVKGPTVEELQSENARMKEHILGLQRALQKAKDISFFMQERFYDQELRREHEQEMMRRQSERGR